MRWGFLRQKRPNLRLNPRKITRLCHSDSATTACASATPWPIGWRKLYLYLTHRTHPHCYRHRSLAIIFPIRACATPHFILQFALVLIRIISKKVPFHLDVQPEKSRQQEQQQPSFSDLNLNFGHVQYSKKPAKLNESVQHCDHFKQKDIQLPLEENYMSQIFSQIGAELS